MVKESAPVLCDEQAAEVIAAQTKAFLAEHGVDLAGEQQTKTKSALDFYAGELQATERQPS